MELTERIRAELDETERVAREADGGSWVVGPTFGGRDNRVYVKPEGFGIDTIGTCVIAGQVSNMPGYRANAEHIALHDPERELRMVAAHRAIVEWCEEVIGDRDVSQYGQFGALADHPEALAVTLAMETLLNLARGLSVEA